MKKIYFTLGILLAATFAMAYLYFSHQDTARNANELSLRAVARNSSVIFCFENDKSFYEILSGQDLLQNVLGENKSGQLNVLKKELISDVSIFNGFLGQKVYIGIVPGEGDSVDYLIGTQLKSEPKKLIRHLGDKLTRIDEKPLIYRLHLNDSTTFFVGLKDNLVLLSASNKQIRLALNEQQPDESFANFIQQNNRFNRNTLANLYLNFNHFPALLKNILNSNLTGELNIFNRQNSFAALSYNFSKEKILFNGTTVINNGDQYEAMFADMPAQQQTIVQILPENTANYTSYTLNNYAAWQKKLRVWLAIRKEDQKIAGHLARLNQKYRLDLQQIFPAYFKDQLLTFQLNTGEKFGAISLKNGEKVIQLLLDLSADYAPDVKIFKEPYLPYAFFGEPFRKFERPFYTIIDNYLIMANNASSIQSFLNSYNNNHLLLNTTAYSKFSEQLPSAATICYYVNQKNSNDIFGRNLKMPFYKQYLSKNGFRSYDAFAYQLMSDQGRFQSNILLFKKLPESSQTDTLNVN